MAPFIVPPVLALVIVMGLLLIGFVVGSNVEEAVWRRQIRHMAGVIRDAREMSSMLLEQEGEENA